MPASESQKDDDRLAAETKRIKAAYGRRQCGDLYSWFNPGQLFLLQERERRVLNLLRQPGTEPPGRTRKSSRSAATPATGWANLSSGGPGRRTSRGSISLASAWLTARSVQAAKVGLVQANAAYLPFSPATFDLVLQSTVFTSILDAGHETGGGRGDAQGPETPGPHPLV